MKSSHRLVFVMMLIGFLFPSLNSADTQSESPATLQDAIKSRTDVTILMQEVAEMASDVRRPMRKLIARGEVKQMEGNILLSKDKYPEAVKAYDEAAQLYRKALDGRKTLEKLAEAQKKVLRSRILAEATVEPDKTQKARTMEINAEGYIEAAEFEQAIAELDKARALYESLLAPKGSVTLEKAVAARTRMLAARKQVRNLPEFDADRRNALDFPIRASSRDQDAGVSKKGPKKDSLPDIIQRAINAELAAADSLEEREYTPAFALFEQAEKLYLRAAELQATRDKVVATRDTARESMKLADSAFITEARPASFERGKQALEDGENALDEEELNKAKDCFSSAVEYFSKARNEAEASNELAKSRDAWTAALTGADEDLLTKHVSISYESAKGKAAQAEEKAADGDMETAKNLFDEAISVLKDASDKALTRENQSKAAPIIARLETAITKGEKFKAEDVLAELEKLIPGDSRMPGLRRKVESVPWKKSLDINLGDGVRMKMVLIRPGSFVMGSENGGDDEKPVRKVTITQPCYMGVYEVTQAQYEKIMGSNPSNFKGSNLPVEKVSWNDAKDFCRKLSEKTGQTFSLPTEAQWEYACRAGTTTSYCYGDSENSLGDYAWYNGNSGSKTHPVGEKKPNPWGLYDMHGNVWERCEDWFDSEYYANSPLEDPTGPGSGAYRVVRGGGWCGDARICRSAYRAFISPRDRSGLGFRVCLQAGGR